MPSTPIRRARVRLTFLALSVAAAATPAASRAAQSAPPAVPPRPAVALPSAGSQPSAIPPAARPTATVAETPLYKIPTDGTKLTDTVASPDNRHVGVIESRDRTFWAVVDGVRGPAHEWVIRQSFGFALDGGRFAYQVQQGPTMHVVTGRAGGPAGAPGTSPSAAAPAGTAPSGPPTWDPVGPGYYMVGRMVFSADGKRFAYAAQKERDGKMHVVLDGQEQPAVDEVYAADMQFSPDGKRFAYRARKADPGAPADPANPKAGGKQFYVIDGAAQPAYDLVARLTFSPDGGRYGYIARAGKQGMMVIDGKPLAAYAVVAGLVFSPDGKRYAYAVEPADANGNPSGKQSLVYNSGAGDKQFQPFDGLGAIAFSPDGRRIAITTLTDKKWNVVVDGKTVATYDGTGGLLFSPDSKRLAVVGGRNGRQFVAVDGRELPAVDVVAAASFGPDSARVATVAIMGGQRWLFLDDRRVGPGTFFAFSPDGAWLAHAVPTQAQGQGPQGQGRFTLAVDAQPVGPEYDASPPGARLVWESPTVLRTIAGRGNELFLVRATLSN